MNGKAGTCTPRAWPKSDPNGPQRHTGVDQCLIPMVRSFKTEVAIAIR